MIWPPSIRAPRLGGSWRDTLPQLYLLCYTTCVWLSGPCARISCLFAVSKNHGCLRGNFLSISCQDGVAECGPSPARERIRGFLQALAFRLGLSLGLCWRHPCRLAPRNQLLGSSLPALGLTAVFCFTRGYRVVCLVFVLSYPISRPGMNMGLLRGATERAHLSTCMCCLQFRFPNNGRDRH